MTYDLTDELAAIDCALRDLALTPKSESFKSMLGRFGVSRLAELDDTQLVKFRQKLEEFRDRQPDNLIDLIRHVVNLAYHLTGEPRPWHQGELKKWRDAHPRLTEEKLTVLVQILEAIADEQRQNPSSQCNQLTPKTTLRSPLTVSPHPTLMLKKAS